VDIDFLIRDEFPIFEPTILNIKNSILPYKFIYFDLDDTLLDHRSAEASALNDVHQHFSFFEGISPDKLVDPYQEVNSKQWTLYSRGDIGRKDLQRNRFEQTLRQLNLDGNKYKEVGDYYLQCYRNHWQWVDGAEDAYREIIKKYPVGILTNGFAETQKMKFEKFDLHNSADHLVISEEVGVLKPDPKVFEHATELANTAPKDILYVGDSFTSDIKGGSQFGWNTAWYTKNGDAQKHQKVDFVFNNFTDLITFLDVQN
jgi:putative hydrolase of the HAD superfamily